MHLRRLLPEYVAYHHEDRTHCGLGKQTPRRRAAQHRPSANAKGIALLLALRPLVRWQRQRYRRGEGLVWTTRFEVHVDQVVALAYKVEPIRQKA